MKLSESVFACGICGRVYNHAVLSKCPGCAGAAKSDPANQEKNFNPARQADARNAEITDLLREIARASNRTTYAVRSMVSYTVITVITFLITLVFAGLTALGGGGPVSAFFGIIGALVFLTGIVYALATLIREWKLSDVSKR